MGRAVSHFPNQRDRARRPFEVPKSGECDQQLQQSHAPPWYGPGSDGLDLASGVVPRRIVHPAVDMAAATVRQDTDEALAEDTFGTHPYPAPHLGRHLRDPWR